MQKVFISHSYTDRAFATSLAAHLKELGLSIWWDAEELNAGDYIKGKIAEGIESSSIFVIVLSENSAKSNWVRWELNSALLYNATKSNIRIIPVKIDGTALPDNLSDYLYVDASRDINVAIQAVLNLSKGKDDADYQFTEWSELSSKQFEGLVYELLVAEYKNVSKMPVGKDAGVDFVIEGANALGYPEKILVMLQHTPKSVDYGIIGDVGDLIKLTNANKVLLVASQEFTKWSRAFLDSSPNLIIWESRELLAKLARRRSIAAKYFPSRLSDEGPVLLIDQELELMQGLAKGLNDCLPGKDGWKSYEEACVKILNYLFVPPLGPAKLQARTENGIDIRDAIYPNRSYDENWRFVRDSYDAKYIVFEFKNYAQVGAQIDKWAVLQLSDYLKAKTMGRFGMICSTKAPNRSGLEKRKQIFSDEGKLILFINNGHLVEMLERKYKKLSPFDIISELIDDFNYSF